MGEIASVPNAPGLPPMRSRTVMQQAASETPLARNRAFVTTIILLALVGLGSLILAEQIAAGWIALGERANIGRGSLNVLEITAIAACAVWGVIALGTALGFARYPGVPSLRGYLRGDQVARTPGVLLTLALLSIIGVISLVLAEQVLTGWVALGERANLSRRDLNAGEISAIIIGVVWGLLSLRAAWGIGRRDTRAWTWAQWLILITSLIGAVLLLAGFARVNDILPRGGTISDNFGGTLEGLAPGLLILVSCLAVYRYLTLHTDISAGQAVRNTLAKSPGAGAIVGFFALFIGFTVATDLFLTPQALGGALSTNITNGIVAIGITLLMISGEFDLSVGSTFGATALIFILAMTEGVWFFPPMPAIPAMILALAFAALLGLINGIIFIRTGIPSFIVTLGTLLAYRAIPLLIIPDGRIIRFADYRIPEPVITFSPYVLAAGLGALLLGVLYMLYSTGRGVWRTLRARLANYRADRTAFRDLMIVLRGAQLALLIVIGVALISLLGGALIEQLGQGGTLVDANFFDIANGRIDAIPFLGTLDPTTNLRTGVVWWLLFVLFFQFVLSHTRYGSGTFAVGGNPGAARAQGISVSRMKVTNFVLCAMMAGLAGITFVSRVGSVNANLGDGLELEVIAASVIGGTLLTGGYGSIIGALLGVLIFGMLRTGLVLVGLDARVFYGVIGVIIIVAVVINTAVRRVRT